MYINSLCAHSLEVVHSEVKLNLSYHFCCSDFIISTIICSLNVISVQQGFYKKAQAGVFTVFT